MWMLSVQSELHSGKRLLQEKALEEFVQSPGTGTYSASDLPAGRWEEHEVLAKDPEVAKLQSEA